MKVKIRKELKKKLQKYMNKYNVLSNKYYKQISLLEDKMNKEMKELKLPILEFFMVDGECVGIGAESFEDRRNFPLIYFN